MIVISQADRCLIAQSQNCGGDPHKVAGMAMAFRASILAEMELVDVYRNLLQWYVTKCEKAKKRPNAWEINEKFREFLANYSQSTAN